MTNGKYFYIRLEDGELTMEVAKDEKSFEEGKAKIVVWMEDLESDILSTESLKNLLNI